MNRSYKSSIVKKNLLYKRSTVKKNQLYNRESIEKNNGLWKRIDFIKYSII